MIDSLSIVCFEGLQGIHQILSCVLVCFRTCVFMRLIRWVLRGIDESSFLIPHVELVLELTSKILAKKPLGLFLFFLLVTRACHRPPQAFYKCNPEITFYLKHSGGDANFSGSEY